MSRLVPLMFLACWALGTAAFGTLFALGLTVAYSDPLLVPWALSLAGVGGLILSLLGMGYSRRRQALSVFRLYSLVAVALLIAARLLSSFYPGAAALALLALMEGYGGLVIGRLRAVIETFVTEAEKGRVIAPIRWAAMAGALIGSGVGIGAALLLPEPAFYWLLGGALITCAGLTYGCRAEPIETHAGGLAQDFGAWQRLTSGSPFLQWLLGAAFAAYLLRTTSVAQTVETYSTLLSGTPEGLILFFALLFAASSLALGAAYGIFRLLRRRIGVMAASLTYPCLAFALFLTWTLLPSSFTGPLLVSSTYLALMPALLLPEIESHLSLLPGRFARSLGRLLFGLIPPLGLLAGGLLWLLADALLLFENRLILLTFLSLGLVGTAVGLGLFYRRAWLRYYAQSPLKPVDLPKLSRQQIHRLLAGSDPLFHELALKNAARSKNPVFGPDLIKILAGLPSEPVRQAAYAYLAATPMALSPLLTAKEERVRMRGAAAAVYHRLRVEHEMLNGLMNDPSPAVRMMGCALGWQRGLGEVASRIWEGIDLSTLPTAALVELIEGVAKEAPDALIRVVKKLAWYPAPKVRRAAVKKLGALLEKKGDDPNLLEVALSGIQSEDPTVRAKALPLLLVAGGDNTAVHAASHLSDPAPEVRTAAATTLAKGGGLALATEQLYSKQPQVVEAAIWALAQSGSEGEAALLKFLSSLPPPVEPFRRLPEEAFVNIALRNGRDRAICWTATSLEAIGEGEAAQLLRCKTYGPQTLDLLYRLVPRPYLDPILPIIRRPERERRTDAHVQRDLELLAKSEDPFIRIGAEMALDPQKQDPLMNRLLFLKGLPYFQDLLLEELVLLDQRLEQEEFVKGETIFEEGSEGDRFYLIFQGSVALTHGMRPLTELNAGEGFGEMALFDEEVRSATAIAAADTLLLSLDRAHFHELMQQRPAILLQICRNLSHRLREMDKRFALVSS